MAEAEENREKRCLSSMQMDVFSRDLLHKFMNGNNNLKGKFHEISNEEEEDNLELSLGLSLNGRFGVDPERAKRLKRSSSIANFVFPGGGDESNGHCSFSVGSIARTCSLPVEGEDECRKRKELQSLRRLEAKRKRMEKLQNVRVAVKDKVDLDERPQENDQGPVGNSLPLSQGSMGSQGSGSSGISDFGSQPIQGDVLLGRDKIQKVLLARLTETVVMWLSDEQEFWSVLEDESAPLQPLGLQQLILDMHFTVEIARFAGYPSRHVHQISSDIIARAVRTFSARGIDPQSALPEDEWFTETAKGAINKLLLGGSGSDTSEIDDEHIIMHDEGMSDSDGSPSSLSSPDSSESFASAQMGDLDSPVYLSDPES